MYLGRDGQIDISLTNAGYLAPGVPGTVRGLALAHKRFGTLPWKDVVMPAVLLAEKGFTMSGGLARRSQRRSSPATMRPVSGVGRRVRQAGRRPWAEGDRLVLTDLGRTLRAIAMDGPDVFYKGWIADRIADDMAANGGLITKEDLAAYQAKERTPVRGHVPRLRDHLDAAAELRRRRADRNAQHPRAVPPEVERTLTRAESLHLQIEAMRRALSRSRALPRRSRLRRTCRSPSSSRRITRAPVASSIDPSRKASSSVELGTDIVTATAPSEPDETTHFSVIDRDGMAVASTYTLEGGFGSHVVVKGAGFLLNNEMGDFNKKPGDTNVTRRHWHAAQPDRSGQADAQLDDADDGDRARQGGADHRIAGRPHDHQHGASRSSSA